MANFGFQKQKFLEIAEIIADDCYFEFLWLLMIIFISFLIKM